MATCPKCANDKPTKRRSYPRHYWCQRCGFIRWIGEIPPGYTKEGVIISK